jgi:RNA polymerase sigma-70 factor (ECF subfamily)
MQRSNSAADVEDIAQDAFLQAYLKLDSFHGRSGFFTWLFRIALNLMATRRRRKNREMPFAEMPSLCDDRTMDAAQSPGACLLRKEERARVQTALQRLSDEHRTVLILREYEGFDYETIAEMLDTKVGTIRSRVFRARLALRSEMESLGSSA